MDNILKNMLDNTYSLIIYFGKIINKTTGHRYNQKILNPIIFTKLPSLYKFIIKTNDLLYNQIINKYGDTPLENSIINNMYPVSVSYIHFPNKIYDIMIYQYNKKEGSINELVKIYEYENMFIKINNQHEIRIEMEKKEIENIIKIITNLIDDIHYKYI